MILSIVVLLLLLVATSFQMQSRFLSLVPIPSEYTSISFSFALFIVFLIINKVFKLMKITEPFFFEVDDNNISRCSGLYNGMPTTFQYNSAGSENCKKNKDEPLGFINPNGSESYGSMLYYN